VSTNFVKVDSNSLDFLFTVSHFTDNVTQPLDNGDGEETEDYDIGDFFRRTYYFFHFYIGY